MAKGGINKVILVGNLGNDPETRYMPNGNAVTNISVATSESWKDKNTGEKVEKTEWHRVVMFRQLGEIAGKYLRKGSKVYIEGKLQTRKWQAQDGSDRYSTEIIGEDMQMLDSRGAGGQGDASYGGGQGSYDNNQGGGNQGGYGGQNTGGYQGGGGQPRPPQAAPQAPQQAPPQAPPQAAPQPRSNPQPMTNDFDSDIDDDIPF